MRTHRLVLTGLCALALALLGPAGRPGPAAAVNAADDWDIPGGRFFTQTRGGAPAGYGYSVTDDAVAPFWSEFQRLGGVQAVGYPVSRRFVWNGFVVQAFQKAIFQWRPEVGRVYFVNVFDEFTNLGKDGWLEVVRSTPRPAQFNEQGLSWDQIIANRLKLLDDYPAIRAAYFGVGDWLNLNGLPMAPVKDYGNVRVLRAQRVIIQQWMVDVPWARAGQVVFANGGDVAKEAGIIPQAATQPEDPAAYGAAPVSNPPARPAPAPPGFGYGMQIDPYNDLNRALGLVQQAGFNWVKVQVRWEDIEAVRGQIGWDKLDPIVNATSGAGINLLFSVVTAPRWARPADTDFSVPGPPANPQDYANFVGALASRYRGKVKAYEIWNEQNLWYEWGGAGRQSAPQYVALLRAAYAAIKAADPSALVITGAPTPAGTVNINGQLLAIDDLDYFRQMYAAGMKGYFDGVGVHPSGYNNPPDDFVGQLSPKPRTWNGTTHPSFFFRRFEQYYQVMVENGDADKKLWFTEFGWASSPNPYPEYAYARDNSEQDQASYLVRAFQIGREKGYVAVMFVWNLNFASSADPQDRYAKRAFSILNPDWTPRPAYLALAAMPK